MDRVFIGIDPGQSGAMAVIGDGFDTAIPFSESAYLKTLVDLDAKRTIAGTELFAIVEHVGPMPKQGVSSTFKFGMNFGWIQGLLYAIGIPFELVRPQKWKKAFSCTSDKNTSISVAQRMFPRVPLFATPRCRKPHDGMAEALLMAEYGRRIFSTVGRDAKR
jgi:crossover junction endodeoxyribonuclease RuvC